jgi:hypothetical protein
MLLLLLACLPQKDEVPATDTGDTVVAHSGALDTVDTGAVDTGAVDTGAVDTGAVDTGAVDTALPETEPVGVVPDLIIDAGAALALVVAGAGDVDGDGLDDVLIGSPQDGGADIGAVYLLLSSGALARGASTLGLGDADLRLIGEAAGDLAGTSIAGVGDVDGDGRADLLVGAPGQGARGVSPGAAYLLLSSGALSGAGPTLSLADADLKIVGEEPADLAGRGVAIVSDLDGDGRAELLIGAPGQGEGGEDAGAAYLLLSSGALKGRVTTLALDRADLKLIGEREAAYAGFSVSGAGDVDGDGLAELIIGAPDHFAGVDAPGAAYLLLSAGALAWAGATLELAFADLRLDGEAGEDYAGSSVASAGDVDGDGLDDLIIGADGHDGGGDGAGAAYLLLSSGTLSSGGPTLGLGDADLTLVGEADGDYAGYSVAGVDDAEGDGLADLLIGAPRDGVAGEDAGAATLFCSSGALSRGASAVSVGDADEKLHGTEAEQHAGWSVASAGDVNGDGLDELLVGTLSAGRVFLYFRTSR